MEKARPSVPEQCGNGGRMVATARPPALERSGIYPGFTGLVQTWAFVTARRPDWPCNVALAYLPTPAKSTLCAHRTPGKGA